MPIFLECDRCTACCRWPGQVRLAPGELERIAVHLGMNVDVFIEEHTRLTVQRNGLALLDQTNGACEWLDGDACRINPVKPQQCRDFPNLWNFPEAAGKCQAKPVDVTPADWTARILAATGRRLAAPALPLVPEAPN